jgi:hypothetical protein
MAATSPHDKLCLTKLAANKANLGSLAAAERREGNRCGTKGLKVRRANATSLLCTRTTERDKKLNFAIGNTQALGWKRLKLGYVVAAAALALAVTAAAGIALTRDGSSGQSGPSNITQPEVSGRVQQSQTYIYVVGSQEEAVNLERAFNEADGGTNFLFEVLVVDTPEAETSFQLAQRELSDAGLSGNSPGLVIVDTR